MAGFLPLAAGVAGLLLAHSVAADAMPDLAPLLLQAPEVVTAPPNPTVTFVCEAVNRGSGTAEGQWWNRVYLCPEPEPDETAVVVAEWLVTGPLASGETYRRTNTVSLPMVASGPYFLVLDLDAGSELAEADEANNRIVALVWFEAIVPDLKPIGFEAPAVVTGSLLPTITLVWGVTNCGATNAAGWWSDVVYFSNDGVEWTETLVGKGESGPLAAGGSYWRTNTARLPVVESGTYYVMFTTDAENSLYESDTNNNFSVVVPVTFTYLAPDLAPIALQPPAVIAGAPHPFITLVWGVTNQGVGPATAPWGWTDRVYSSTDPWLDESDYPAGMLHQDGPLAAGACYWVTNTVRVAAAQSGTYYLILEVDWGNGLHDSDTENNMLVVPVTITVSPPDIAALALQAPERVTGPPNPTVTIVWGVTNQGAGPAEGLLGDRIYVSAEPVPNPANEVVVCWNVENGPLEAGGSYWQTNTVRLPVVESGIYYLILAADADDVLGDADRSNNMLAVPVEFDISAPDLMPVALQAPNVVTAAPNSSITVVWKVSNEGAGEAVAGETWTDKLYLSHLDYLDSTAVAVASAPARGPLPAGGVYWQTNTARLPDVESGTYYLILAVNATSSLYEWDTNNNELAVPVTVTMQPADLVPVVAQVPKVVEGSPKPKVTLVWGAVNQGAQPAIGSQPWSDNVYFSTKAQRDGSEVWIGETRQSGPVAPGASYSHSSEVQLPATHSGTYYLIFHTDAFNTLRESDESNNVTAVQVSIDVRPPDLAPIALQAPSFISGPPNPTVALVWGVTNAGTGLAMNWLDKVYLSTNAVLDSQDAEIAKGTEAGPLGPGGTYWRTNTVKAPVLTNGTYYLIFKTDAGSTLYESNEGNNVLVMRVTFEVLPPDLAAIALQAPSVVTGPSNPDVTVVWGVTNQGAGPAIGWFDRLYVSTNAVWDAGDVGLLVAAEPGPIESGGSYWRTKTVRVPVIKSGTYYLILKADADASLYELDEGNNTFVVPVTFDVQPPDVAPLVLRAPTVVTGPFDLTVTLIWGVTNRGAGAAIGSPSWYSRVYLSDEPTLDEDDDDIVDSMAVASLEPGGSCWRTNTVSLPVFRNGPYNLFFKADAGNNLYEASETNNLVAVRLMVTVVTPALFARDKRIEPLPYGGVRLPVYGDSRARYALHGSTDLVTWARIAEFTCPEWPTWIVHSPDAVLSYRFYRIELLTIISGEFQP